MNHYENCGGMQANWAEPSEVANNEAEVGIDVEGYRESYGMQIEADGDNVAEEGLYGSGVQTWGEHDVIGMGFDTVEEAENFYTMYAQAIGFGVRNSSTVYNRQMEGPKQLVGKLFVCCCEGQRDPKWCDIDSRKRQPRALTRTDCKAKMRVKLDSTKNKWVISQFQAEHNHELVCGKEQSFIRANRCALGQKFFCI